MTFFDRHGADGALILRALRHALTVFLLALLMFGLLGSLKLGLRGGILIVFTLVCALTLSAVAAAVGLKAGDAAAGLAKHIYMGGSGTQYDDQFSREQALVMQRDYGGALALYEQRIASAPDDPRVRIAAADLYQGHGENPARAAELYREIQRMPNLESGHDIYVSNKLADLFLGPLRQRGRALVELRRLAERYPGTPAAQYAKAAIANLKADTIGSAE